MELRPRTDGGRRFCAVMEGHVEAFRKSAAAHDAEGSLPAENFTALQRSGGLAAFIPEELGGLGLESVHDWAVGLERLGRGDASTAIALNMHLAVTRNLVAAWRASRARGDAAGADRNEAMLRSVVAGKLVICATATEAGTDFLRPATTATRRGDGWVIDGRKIFVTLSPVANLCALNVRVRAEVGMGGADGAGAGAGAAAGDSIGFAFVGTQTPGFEPQHDWDALGMRASGSQSVVFRDCAVADGAVQVVGEWGRWNPALLIGRTLGNLTLVAVFLGIAERARELAVAGALAQAKPKYGGALARSSGVQHLMGEIDIDLAGARAVLGETAVRIDAFLAELGGRAPSLEEAHGCMRDYQCAKWIVNQSAIRIVSRAMDVAGGGAYMTRHELSRLYRDVRGGPFMQPFSPTEAREYIGQVAFGLYPEG